MKFDHVDLNDSVTEGSAADIEDEEVTTSKKKVKKLKKKKIHFRSDYANDGTYESSSSDEEQREKTKNQYSILDLNPSQLSWARWCWYYVVSISLTTFHAAEYCGEKLADFFGITAPKYQYVINEYHRLKQEEEEEEAAMRREEEYARKKEAEEVGKLEGGEKKEVTLNDKTEKRT